MKEALAQMKSLKRELPETDGLFWFNTMYIQMYGSDRYGYEGEFRNLISESEAQQRQSEAQPVVAVAYFISFILLGTMIVLNLFTGTIIVMNAPAVRRCHAPPRLTSVA